MPAPLLLLLLLGLGALILAAAVAVLLLRSKGAGDGDARRAWELLDNPAAALPLFDRVARSARGKPGKPAKRQAAQAQLGKAICQVRLGKLDQAALTQEAPLESDLLSDEEIARLALAWYDEDDAPSHAVTEPFLRYLELPDDSKDPKVARRMAGTLGALVEVADDADRATVQHAIELGERLVEAVPGLDDVQFALGKALTRQGRAKDAMGPLAAAVRGNPASSDRQLALGRACRAAGQARNARHSLLAAYHLRRDYVTAREAGQACWLTVGEPLSEVEMKIAGEAYPAEAARKLLREGLAEGPDDPSLWLALGHVQAKLGEHAAAVESLQRGVEGGKGGAEDYLQLARSHAALAKEGVEGATDQARAAARQALHRKADHTEARELAGDLAYAAGAYPEALEHYDRLPRAVRDLRGPQIARCCLEAGRAEDAVKLLEGRRHHLTGETRLVLGRALGRLGRWKEAAEVLQTNPAASAEYRYYLGNALAGAERYDEAEATLTPLRDDAEWGQRTCRAMGHVRTCRGDLSGAAKWYDTAGDATTTLDRGRLDLLRHDAARARATFAPAAKTDPAARLGLALADAQLGDLSRLNALIDDPELGRWVQIPLGHRSFDAGDYGTAAKAYEKALPARRENASSLLLARLAAAYVHLRRHADALPLLAELIRRYPRSTQVQYNLALCRYHVGHEHFRARRWDMARAQWRRCSHLLRPLSTQEADGVRRWEDEATYRAAAALLDLNPPDLPRARQMFDDGCETFPEEPRWWFGGLTAALSGDQKTAAERFDEGLKRSPRPSFALGSGLSHFAAGDDESAAQSFRRAVELCETEGSDPDGVFALTARLALGASHARKGRWADSAKLLEETMASKLLDRPKREGLAQTAVAYHALGGDRDRAAAIAKKHLKGGQSVGDLLLAVVQAEAGDLVGAAAALEKVYKSERNPDVARLLATCLLGAAGARVLENDLAGAGPLLERAAKYDGAAPDAAALAGAVSFALQLEKLDVNQLDKTIQHCEKMLKEGHVSPGLLRALAVLYHRRALANERKNTRPDDVWRNCLSFWRDRLLTNDDFWKSFGTEYNAGRKGRDCIKDEDVQEWRQLLPGAFARSHCGLAAAALQKKDASALERHLGLVWDWEPQYAPAADFLGQIPGDVDAAIVRVFERVYGKIQGDAKKALGSVLAVSSVNAGADDFKKANEARERAGNAFGQAAELNKSGLEEFNAAFNSLGNPQSDPQAFVRRIPGALPRIRSAISSLEQAESILTGAKQDLNQAKTHANSARTALRKALQYNPTDAQIAEVVDVVEKVVTAIGEELELADKFASTIRENKSVTQSNLNQLVDLQRRF